MEPDHAGVRAGERGRALLQEALPRETPGRRQPEHRPLVLDQEPGGVTDADLGGHAEQLGAVDGTGDPQPHRQGHAASAHPHQPAVHRIRVEDQVADDRGRVCALVPHRLDRDVVTDQGMWFRVAGDPDVGEGAAERAQVLQHRQGGVVVALGWRLVAGGHEDLADARGRQPVAELGEVAAVTHHPGSQVGHDGVTLLGESLGKLQGRVQALGRGGGHRHHAVTRQVLEHLVLDVGRREHLMSGGSEQAGHELNIGSFVAHGASHFVTRDVSANVPTRRPGGNASTRPLACQRTSQRTSAAPGPGRRTLCPCGADPGCVLADLNPTVRVGLSGSRVSRRRWSRRALVWVAPLRHRRGVAAGRRASRCTPSGPGRGRSRRSGCCRPTRCRSAAATPSCRCGRRWR